MTKAFTFGSWEGFLTIGCYLKAFTGVLAIHRFDSQVPIFLLKRSKGFFESYAQISLFSLFTSLRTTAGLPKRIYFHELVSARVTGEQQKKTAWLKRTWFLNPVVRFVFVSLRRTQCRISRTFGAKLTDHKRHLAHLKIHNACSMQITAEIIQKGSRLSRPLKEEITCNQARKQKCNYRTKQSIHA